MKIALFLVAAALTPLWSQEIEIPAALDKLAAKAENTVDVMLDGPMLKFAGRLFSSKDKGDVELGKVLSNLKSITVKSYEFSRDQQYDDTDLDAIRSQVKGPPWSRIVGVRSKNDDNVDVFFKDGGNGNLGGIVVLVAGARELTIVSLVGTIDPSQLAELGGHYGIPRLDLGMQIYGKRSGK